LKRVEAAAAARTTAATIGSEKAATTKTPEELKAQAKKRADELAKKIASAKPFLKKKRVEAPKKEETKKKLVNEKLEAQKKMFMEHQAKAIKEHLQEIKEAQPRGTATSWGPSKVTTEDKSGKKIKVDAHTKGSWAVHKDPQDKYGSYIITHIQSGSSASGPFNSMGEAKAVLDRALSKHPAMLAEEKSYVSEKAHSVLMESSMDWHKDPRMLSDKARPTAWTEGPISVSRDGKSKVHGERLGVLGLHRQVTTGVGGRVSWFLTHQPSGFRLKSFDSEKEAKAFMKVALEKAPSLKSIEDSKDLVKYKDILSRGVDIGDLRRIKEGDPGESKKEKTQEQKRVEKEKAEERRKEVAKKVPAQKAGLTLEGESKIGSRVNLK
jgi:hypothetical protein